MGEVIIWRLFNQVAINPRVFGVPTDEAGLSHARDVELPHVLDYLESQLPADGFPVRRDRRGRHRDRELLPQCGILALSRRRRALAAHGGVRRARARARVLREAGSVREGVDERSARRSSAPRSPRPARRSRPRRTPPSAPPRRASCRSERSCRNARPRHWTNGRLGLALCQRLAEASRARRCARSCARSARPRRARAARARAARGRDRRLPRSRVDRAQAAGCDAAVHLVGILKETRANRYVDAHERACEALARRADRCGLRRIAALSILGAALDSPTPASPRARAPTRSCSARRRRPW
jgi:hypothetical protein